MRGGLLERGRIIMTTQRKGKGNVAINSRTRETIRPSEGWGGKGGEPRAQVIIMGQGGNGYLGWKPVPAVWAGISVLGKEDY